MRILQVTPAYYPATYWGGPIFTMHALNTELAKLANVTVRVLTTDSAGPELTNVIDKYDISCESHFNHTVLFTHRVAGKSVSIELLKILPQHIKWADIVHLNATYSFPTIPTLLLCRLFRKPIVWSPRGAIYDTYQWNAVPRKRLKHIWEFFCNAILLKNLSITHATSEAEQVVNAAAISKIPSITIKNGIFLPELTESRDWQPGGKLRLIYIGRISSKKGIENLLFALASLNDDSISLRIYGTGNQDYVSDIIRLADELKLLNRVVTFFGHVDDIEKSNAFHAADVCVVPSHIENFCMVIAEALSYGIPVIASRGTPWKEIEEKQCGLWVDNRPESLAAAIKQIRTMPLSEMGHSGYDWMKNDFSWENSATEMLKTYHQLLSTKYI